ncbi:uncharacterized protein LOC143692237 isoform X3 [Agelaius phoeniceus]|uniref:uncharacterized protein LOC143692237 isoform X3 n=1 Tax=Agelaius phoeniceus TaxID=39638 RepID=UPI00405508C2
MRGAAAGSGRGAVAFNRGASPPWRAGRTITALLSTGRLRRRTKPSPFPETQTQRAARAAGGSTPLLSSPPAWQSPLRLPCSGGRETQQPQQGNGEEGWAGHLPLGGARRQGDSSGAQWRTGEAPAAERGGSASSRHLCEGFSPLIPSPEALDYCQVL